MATKEDSRKMNSIEFLNFIQHQMENEKVLCSSAILEQILKREEERRTLLIEKKLMLEEATGAKADETMDSIENRLQEIQMRHKTLKGQVSNLWRNEIGALEKPEVFSYMESISVLEKTSSYLRHCEFVKSTSEQIEANLETGLDSESVELYYRLILIRDSFINASDCRNLQNYWNSTIEHWGGRLEEKFIKDFEEELEAFGWPMKLTSVTPTLENHDKFHKTIKNILQLDKSTNTINTIHERKYNLLPQFQDFSLPIKVMMKPIKKRFDYHFYGSRQTNDPSKPEWYFSQVKNWIRNLTPFVQTHLPRLEGSRSSVEDFILYLTEMLLTKADSQLLGLKGPEVDEIVFAKILEESILYEKEMRSYLREIKANEPSFTNLLFSQHVIFQRWIGIERKASLEKMDEIFGSSSTWKRAIVPGPPEIIDLFLAIIKFLIERFAYLEQPKQKAKFLMLLNEILDDFRVRTVQTWKSLSEIEGSRQSDVLIDYTIAEAVQCIQEAIESWENHPIFSTIAYYISNLSEAELEEEGIHQIQNIYEEGLFGKVLGLNEYLLKEIESKWVLYQSRTLQDSLKEYFLKKWHLMELKKEIYLSDEFILCIQILKPLFSTITSHMEKEIANSWLKALALRFDDILFDRIVKGNKFSEGAIAQIKYDLFNGIFPIFSQVGPTSDLFRKLKSSFVIWEMKYGEALLFFETLGDPLSTLEMQEAILSEVNFLLRPSVALFILRTRLDFS